MPKNKADHLIRKAFLYIRQSTLRQVYENTESTKRQYALKGKLISMGWDESRIEVIDSDLGQSGAESGERRGFQYLVSEVSLGRAGIVAGIEVSRLSRSSADWNKLLQIAALSDTIIMDEDGTYNVNDFNDRLLLGLKGTLSEAELHYLKARMRGGLLNKAKRGELKRSIPIGYVYDDNGQIAKDPDAQVQEAIMMFFRAFKRIGSAHGLICEYSKEGVLFPSRPFNGFRLGELSWKSLSRSKAVETLRNPLYAGIYVYGKQQMQQTAGTRKLREMPKEQYYAWLPGSHPAYISEAQFEENCQRLAKNSRPKPGSVNGGAVREGAGLLQGIAFCGICGKMMHVHYRGRKSDHQYCPYYLCNSNNRNHGGDYCQRVPGVNIDKAIETLLLETINPMTTEAAILIQREMTRRKEEILRLYAQQMERARYEMDLAKRRYLRVDPDNRLIAAELERDWNQKVSEYESAKTAYEQKCEAEIRAVDEKLESALKQLVSDFPKIWNDQQTSNREKKRIASLILEDVTITSDSTNIVLGVRFKGGSTRILELPKKGRDLYWVNMELSVISEIKSLLFLGLSNQEISDALNERGFKRMSGKPFDYPIVNYLIRSNGMPKRVTLRRPDDAKDWLTCKEKMEEIGVTKTKLRNMRESGRLIYITFFPGKKMFLYKPEDSVNV